MAALFQLEEFEASDPLSMLGAGLGMTLAATPGKSTESIGVTFYEQGYQAGWDDAAKAAADEQAHFSAEFSHNLQDLGFTFQEARSQVVHSLEPLLTALVEQVFPTLVQQTLAQSILEEISPLIDIAADTPIQIVVSEENQATLEPILASNFTYPLELIVEKSMGPGQVFLRAGNAEKHIDLDGALQSIAQAIKALDQPDIGALSHG